MSSKKGLKVISKNIERFVKAMIFVRNKHNQRDNTLFVTHFI